MRTNRTIRTLTGVVLLAVGVLVIAFNAINLSDAYGSGPPYYARTMNMDKWTNPLPVLAAVDIGFVLACAVYGRWIRRKTH